MELLNNTPPLSRNPSKGKEVDHTQVESHLEKDTFKNYQWVKIR